MCERNLCAEWCPFFGRNEDNEAQSGARSMVKKVGNEAQSVAHSLGEIGRMRRRELCLSPPVSLSDVDKCVPFLLHSLGESVGETLRGRARE